MKISSHHVLAGCLLVELRHGIVAFESRRFRSIEIACQARPCIFMKIYALRTSSRYVSSEKLGLKLIQEQTVRTEALENRGAVGNQAFSETLKIYY